jgi:hypothetical protein
MKVIQLPDVLHEYLLGLIEMHAGRGIHPEEGLAVNRLWDAVKNRATHIDEAAIQMMAGAASPDGQSPVSVVDHTGKAVTVECQRCWDEEGSQACIRPAHQARQTGPIEDT